MLPEILQSCLLSDRVKPEFGGSTLVLTNPPCNTYTKADIWTPPQVRIMDLPFKEEKWAPILELPAAFAPLHPLHRPPGTTALCEIPSADWELEKLSCPSALGLSSVLWASLGCSTPLHHVRHRFDFTHFNAADLLNHFFYVYKSTQWSGINQLLNSFLVYIVIRKSSWEKGEKMQIRTFSPFIPSRDPFRAKW